MAESWTVDGNDLCDAWSMVGKKDKEGSVGEVSPLYVDE